MRSPLGAPCRPNIQPWSTPAHCQCTKTWEDPIPPRYLWDHLKMCRARGGAADARYCIWEDSSPFPESNQFRPSLPFHGREYSDRAMNTGDWFEIKLWRSIGESLEGHLCCITLFCERVISDQAEKSNVLSWTVFLLSSSLLLLVGTIANSIVHGASCQK